MSSKLQVPHSVTPNGGVGPKVFMRLVSFQGSLVGHGAGTPCKGLRVRETMAYLGNCKLFPMAEAHFREMEHTLENKGGSFIV